MLVATLKRDSRKSKGMANLVEVEDEIQLAYVAEELIQHFDEEVDGFQIG